MKTKNNSLILVFIGLLCCISLPTCSSGPIDKGAPEYKGVDLRVKSYVNEYKALAKIQGITFKHQVTIGFKKINDGEAVGLTTYGDGWREIDVDEKYWNESTETTRMILIYHELGHAYCTRDHDYGDGTKYPDPKQIRNNIRANKFNKKGYYPDYCPLSVMYPVVLNDLCTLEHYGDYIVEMFNRCVAW